MSNSTNHQKIAKKLSDNPDAFSDISNALKILGDKWSVLILICLVDQPTRFTDIEELLPKLNPRTLTTKLKKLEKEGLVSRQVFKQFPPRVEYSITNKALELRPVIKELKVWAKKHCTKD